MNGGACGAWASPGAALNAAAQRVTLRLGRYTSWLTRQINAIKADLLKIKRRDPQAPTGGTFVTHASPAEVRKRIPKVLGEDFYETSADGDPTQKGGLKAEIWKNPKGDIGADGSFPPEYEMGRPATPEEVHWACDHAELFRGKGQRRKAKGKAQQVDLDGFYDLDMSI